MDASSLHYVITGFTTVILPIMGFFGRQLLAKIKKLEEDLAAHKLEDVKQFATLNTQNDEIMRTLNEIKHSLEKVNDKLDKPTPRKR